MVAESDPAERANPDVPKVVAALQPDGRSGRCLYFTRSTLYGEGPVWLHHGIYGFRREALARFTAAQPSPLEKRERLEQLRALEMGMEVWAAVIDEAPISVDNPADLERARAFARAQTGDPA
jgi:3-deoxy-manno-octulosonate cytidylyltransferase (CMP-KDO synthetase)